MYMALLSNTRLSSLKKGEQKRTFCLPPFLLVHIYCSRYAPDLRSVGWSVSWHWPHVSHPATNGAYPGTTTKSNGETNLHSTSGLIDTLCMYRTKWKGGRKVKWLNDGRPFRGTTSHQQHLWIFPLWKLEQHRRKKRQVRWHCHAIRTFPTRARTCMHMHIRARESFNGGRKKKSSFIS